MIHYDLRCTDGHEFDGWFKDSAAYDKQAKRGLLECPVCGTASVERALMAPAVPRKGNALPAPAPAQPPPGKAVAGRMPDHVRAMLQKMRAEVERNCDYVGEDFAEEARRMHRGDSERRGIYGEANDDQAEALAEEGIEVARIPWVPRAEG